METLSIVVMNWRDIRNPAAGGAEVFTHEVTRRWAKRGHDVTLLTSRYAGSPDAEVIDGVDVRRQGTRYTVYHQVKRVYLESYRGHVDVVVDEINTIPFFTPKYVNDGARLFSLIFQLAREGWFYETPYPLAVLGRYLLEERWLRLYSDLPAFTISESTKRDLVALGFRKVAVVPPGIPSGPGDLRFEKELRPTLLYIGRLKKYKLPDEAVAAFRMVRERIPDAQLWIVGDGYMLKQLEKRAPPGVSFFGWVDEAYKTALTAKAHILLFPSVREGWGLGVTEANALGVPAIGYDVPGLRDSIRQGVSGVLVAPHDVQGMADAAVALLKDERRLRELADGALRWAKSLDWDATANQMLQSIAEGSEPRDRLRARGS